MTDQHTADVDTKSEDVSVPDSVAPIDVAPELVAAFESHDNLTSVSK